MFVTVGIKIIIIFFLDASNDLIIFENYLKKIIMNKIKLITFLSLFFIALQFTSCGDTEPVDPALLIEVPEPTCDAPITLNVSNFINGTSVNVTWTASSDSSNWEIQYGLKDFVIGSGTTVTASTPLKTINGLDATKQYDFYIRTICDAGLNSEWVGPVSVGSSISVCANPTAVTALRSAVVTSEITVSWLTAGNENSWEIQYGNTGFVIGTGTTVASSTNSKVISGLQTTSYDFYVRSKCSATSFSNWVGPINVIAVGGTTCASPTNLTVVRSANTNTEITVNWTVIPTIAEYEIQYGATAFNIGNGTIISATNGSRIITGLQTTGYDFYIRSRCTATSFSNWVGPINVAAVGAVSCSSPTNLTAVRSANTNTEITVNWTVVPTIAEYEIQYGATAFNIGNGTIIGATNGSRVITGLQTTGYDFYIRSRCTATSFSNWVGPINVAAVGSSSGITGNYKLTAYNTSIPTNLDGNNTTSTNQLNETNCYNNTFLTLSANNTFVLNDKGVTIINSAITCFTGTNFTGTWLLDGDTLTLTYDDNGTTVYEFFIVAGTTLSQTDTNIDVITTDSGNPLYISCDVTEVYTKQ